MIDLGSIFSNSLKNGKCHKLVTYFLIDISLVNKNNLPKKTESHLVTIPMTLGNVKGLLKP